jgi:uncharacterized protein
VKTEDVIVEPWLMSFDYTRTVGPVVGRFLAGLSNKMILGLRGSDGHVVVPPTGYDPRTSETMEEWIEVGQEGVVTSWTWVSCPLETHPVTEPFAWALIRLDGADTSLLHIVIAEDESAMRTHMRVGALWSNQRRGHIRDIACFQPLSTPMAEKGVSEGSKEQIETKVDTLQPIDRFTYPMRLHYEVTSGFALARCLRALKEGRFVGQRSPNGLVYMPPLGACSVLGLPTEEDVELPNTGTVVSFCVVNIPVQGQGIEVPFACADINIDGSDTTFLGMIQECSLDDVRIGLRVEAVWRPVQQRDMSLASVAYFRPTGEPDRDIDQLIDERRNG